MVADWLGNTPKVALKHYLQVTDADFEKAVQGGAESGALSAPEAAQDTSATSCKHLPENEKAPEKPGPLRSNTDNCNLVQFPKMAGAGFEPTTSRL